MASLNVAISSFLIASLFIIPPLFPCAELNEEEETIQPSYRVLAVIWCYRGHFNPASGVVRALTARNHDVTVLTTSPCEDIVNEYMPDISKYHDRMIIPPSDKKPGSLSLHMFNDMDEMMRANLTILMYKELDKFLSECDVRFDVMFTDFMAAGSLLAARKHNLPVVTNYMGMLMQKGWNKSFFETPVIAVENPSDPPDFVPAFVGALMVGLFDLVVSRRCFNAINDIHRDNLWPLVPYNYGLHPFSYVQTHSILVAHGAEPITHPPGETWANIYPIGFVPDSLTYPKLSEQLASWMGRANQPIVFISLGTVIVLEKEKLDEVFEQFRNQTSYNLIWAVKSSMLKDLQIGDELFVTDHLFMGKYLPQGSILAHPKVKLFVTHCGASSIQDSVYAMKPMITSPGFGDQPQQSNVLVGLKVARLMKSFSFPELQLRIEEMLQKPVYSKMVASLKEFRQNQEKLGGFSAAVDIIEDVIEGKIKVNSDVSPDQLFGYPVATARSIILGVASVILTIIALLAIIVYKIFKGIFGMKKSKSQGKNKKKQ